MPPRPNPSGLVVPVPDVPASTASTSATLPRVRFLTSPPRPSDGLLRLFGDTDASSRPAAPSLAPPPARGTGGPPDAPTSILRGGRGPPARVGVRPAPPTAAPDTGGPSARVRFAPAPPAAAPDASEASTRVRFATRPAAGASVGAYGFFRDPVDNDSGSGSDSSSRRSSSNGRGSVRGDAGRSRVAAPRAEASPPPPSTRPSARVHFAVLPVPDFIRFGGRPVAAGSFADRSGGFMRPPGTSVPPYRNTAHIDSGGRGSMRMRSISAIAEYAKKSPEELRWEDNRAGNRGSKHVPAPAAAAGVAEEPGTCCICLDAAPVYAFVPCGHLCLCQECASTYVATGSTATCPKCRAQESILVRIYQ